LRAALAESFAVDIEDDVERRDLLFNKTPLVDSPRPFEQQRIDADRDEKVLHLRSQIGLEVERALGPREEEVHRLLDLHAHLIIELITCHDTLAHENVAEPHLALPGLFFDRRVELCLRDLAALDERITETIAAIDDGREADAPF